MEPFGHLERLTGMNDRTIYMNLANVYDAATPDEVEAGMNWYSDARSVIATLAENTRMNPIRFAAIVAALSPRIRWNTNLDAAVRIARAAVNKKAQPIVAGLPENRRRAWDIAKSGRFAENIRGPKVTAFFANLIGDEWQVTIDVWMLQAAGVKYANKSTIDDITRTVRSIAIQNGLTAAQVQAIIWTVVRDRWALDRA